ncbi:YggT family protein [Ureibacillus sp. FSL K6-8385]|uniref:YggT family protein n=1 Tax=Ureibacillus terrenus TaxID=118246 RepID=A0A540V472_9BACL|nr:YggT family protein [Ureibacillus terrenus]MED3660328.1 YggT family protein [Ureibacillus terrenus]MED3762484.1 YggT family protein [Ureibacillus terrenus]TQE91552.1 YggT family protein [Ureibacillus terrenus]
MITEIISFGFRIYTLMIIIYILMSWVPATRETAFGQFLEKLCEPYLGFFRRFIPPIGMIDFSPIIALIALSFIERGVYYLLSFLF